MRLRSLLFAPAARPDLLRKLAGTGADAVAIDCEDGTPPNMKEEARSHAREIGEELIRDGRVQVFVRVNGFETPWFADDVAHAIPRGAAGVIVPKVEKARQLDNIGYALDNARHGDLEIIAGLETAAGVADCRELLLHSRVMAGYFGAEDFVADMGGRRTAGNLEVQYARSHIAISASIDDVPILDMVTVAFSDDRRFMREAAEARAMGFTGKLCIHPRQVPLANEAFTPTEDEVAKAQALIDAYAKAGERGVGVIVVDGEMVDEALVAQARRVIEAAP